MLSSISPVGEAARRQRWVTTAAAYVLGSSVAGAGLGATLGAVGGLAGVPGPPASLWIGAVALVLGLAGDLTGRVPSLHRQVDERWLQAYRGWVYGFGYGVQLGTGVVTIVPSSLVWLTWVLALLSGDPVVGGVVGLTFGLGRALPLLLGGRARTVQHLRGLLATMERARRPATGVTRVGHAIVSVTLLGVALL